MKRQSDYTFFEVCSVRPDRMSIYTTSDKPRMRSEAQRLAEANLRLNEKSEHFSCKSRKRVSNAIAWLLELSKNEKFYSIRHHRWYNLRVNFITLTLSSKQIHSDNEIKTKILDQFLTEIRTKFNVEHYVWCAEPQKNGNIHFHLTTNKYIAWWNIRKIWNRCQNKLGYIDRFFDKHGHTDPNSIDVHSVVKIKNLAAYLFKYFTKDSEVREIQGRRWGLSQSLSKAKSCVIELYGTASTEFSQIFHRFKKHIKEYDYARVFYIPFDWVRKLNVPYFVREFDNYKQTYMNPPPLLTT